MQIFVKDASTGGKSMTLKARGSDTVDLVKARFQCKVGRAHNKHRLLFAGKQLKGFRTLAASDVHEQSTLYLHLRLRGGGDTTTVSFDNPMLGQDSESALELAERVEKAEKQRQRADEAEATVQDEVGGHVAAAAGDADPELPSSGNADPPIDTPAPCAGLLEGAGTLDGVLYVFIGAFQTLAIVVTIAVPWPSDWFAWIGSFQFAALFSLDFAFKAGLGVGDGAAFAASLLAPPLLLLYSAWRKECFFGYKKEFWIFGDDDAKAKWIAAHATAAWTKTRSILLLCWLLPSALLGGGAFLAGVEPSGDNTQRSSPPGIEGSTSLSGAQEASTESDDDAANTTTLGGALLALALLWCIGGAVIFTYKMYWRANYKAAQNRGESDNMFFGQWAFTEGSTCLFLYIALAIGPVLACLERVLDGDGAEFWIAALLGPFYALVPPALLGYLAYERRDDAGEPKEDDVAELKAKDEELDTDDADAIYAAHLAGKKEKNIAYGDYDSFKAAVYSLIEPYERKFFYVKPVLMLDKVALATVIKVTDEGLGQLIGGLVVLSVSQAFFLITRPYQENGEDRSELLSRASNWLTAAWSIVIHQKLVSEAVSNAVLTANTVLLLAMAVLSLGPARLVRQLVAGIRRKAAATHWAAMDEAAILNLTPADLQAIAAHELEVISELQVAQIIWCKLDLMADFPAFLVDGEPWREATSCVFDDDNRDGAFASLRSIHLPVCEVLSSDGAQATAGILAQSQLDSLDLGSSPIGDEAMVQLLDGLRDVSLTSLDLSKTGSGVPTASKLAELLGEDSKFKA
eukprot:COSAG01_NODE_8705_length_2690_cov_211.793130_2_plen_801_part_01